MSWLPVYNAWVVFVAIVSLFLWKLLGVLFFIFIFSLSIFFLIGEVLRMETRYPLAFWLFILSEVMAFGSLFWTCLWTNEVFVLKISDPMELPLLGSFLLISSSFTATAFHYHVGLPYSWLFLVPTIFLGGCFVGMQLWELGDCECDLLYTVYSSISFCTIGLHFTHVIVGLVSLTLLLLLGVSRVGSFYVDIGVWYWHFVDYIWLLVFVIVYVA